MPDRPIDPGVLRAARRILDPQQPTATLAQRRIAGIVEEETNLPAMREALGRGRAVLAHLVNTYIHEGDDAYIQNTMDEIDAALGPGDRDDAPTNRRCGNCDRQGVPGNPHAGRELR